MWNIFLLGLLLINFGVLQPEYPTDVENIDLKLDEEEIAFTFMDLPNGESTIIQNSEGENILINTGAPESEDELQHYLSIYGVEEISELIITSPDAEYTGNLKYLLDNFVIEKVILPKSMSDARLGIETDWWGKGTKSEPVQDLNVQVLNEDYSKKKHLGMDLLFEYNETYLLYMTSADKEVENRLLQQHNLSVVNIIKVGDFGNDTGTSKKLLNACDPQTAVVFHKETTQGKSHVLERLKETWLDLYLTNQKGNVTIKMKAGDYHVFTLTLDTFMQMS
ncbi:MAG: ComEC/Rec2 family competence protein [Bacillota bacterium]